MNWLYFLSLELLQINQEQFYFILIFIGILICYLILNPIINMFVRLQSTKILSYVISSLLVLLLILIVMNSYGGVITDIIKISLQSLAAFGGVLILIQGLQLLIKKVTKRRA